MGAGHVHARTHAAVEDKRRTRADRRADRRQRIDGGGQGVDLAPAMIGDEQAVNAHGDRALRIGGMQHAFQYERAFPCVTIFGDLVPRKCAALLSARTGNDLMDYELDKQLPPLPENLVISSRSDMIKSWSKVPGASGGEPTLRELCQRFAASRGHYSIIGTPEDVANEMQRWLENGACDGFNFVPSVYPSGLEDFVTMVIPELQKRGIFRREYEGQTLRDNLGLRRPISRYAKTAKAAE